MSAIFGLIFVQKPPHKAHHSQLKTFFNTLAVLSADKGSDNTGIMAMLSTNKCVVDKDTIAPYEFIATDEWKNIVECITDPNIFVLAGRAGQSVWGMNTIDRVHPHAMNGVVGSIAGRIDDSRNFGPPTAYEVDAQNLFYALGNAKVKNWAKIMSNVNGQYAMSIAYQDTFSIISEDTSVVYVAEFKDLPYRAYAMSKHFLWSAGSISGLEIEEIKRYPAHAIYSYRYGRPLPTGDDYKPAPISMYGTGTRKQDSSVVPPSSNIVGGYPILGATTNYMCEQCQYWIRSKDIFKTKDDKLICGGCKNTLILRGITDIRPVFREQHIESGVMGMCDV